MSPKKFWSEGIRFQCQGSGNCCVSRGGYGYVYLTKTDRQALAAHLEMRTADFTRKHCAQEEGIWKLKDLPSGDCRFLVNKRCSVYAARPTQCRTWPFWPEAMNARTWQKEIASFCPGVGKGPRRAPEEIEAQLAEQRASEDEYGI